MPNQISKLYLSTMVGLVCLSRDAVFVTVIVVAVLGALRCLGSSQSWDGPCPAMGSTDCQHNESSAECVL